MGHLGFGCTVDSQTSFPGADHVADAGHPSVDATQSYDAAATPLDATVEDASGRAMPVDASDAASVPES